eukprot:Opistho-2@43278
MWSSSSARGAPSRVRVSYILGDCCVDAGGVEVNGAHRLGVNATALSAPSGDGAERTLWTGGRDASVRMWAVTAQGARLKHTCSGHTDWVNAVVGAGRDGLAVSASSDASLKVWDARGVCISTMRKHDDYVRALAYSSHRHAVVSGGLDRRIIVWDITTGTGTEAKEDTAVALEMSPTVLEGHKDSVYCVAVDVAGNIIASGSPEQVVRLWDARANRKIAKLRGHLGNIRAVSLNAAGTACLSGSSDHTVRLWDLGQQRCVLTVESHTDSVWALAANGAFGRVLSGGRDRSVCATDLTSGVSRLVCRLEGPVLSLTADDRFETVWTTTPEPNVECWSVDGPPAAADVPECEHSAATDPCSEQQAQPRLATRESTPRFRLKGTPGVVQHHILNDRRHVLARDSSGSLSVWDVTQARCVRSIGVADWQKTVEELFEMTSVPGWFSVDCKTGALCINLDGSQCFAAEVYASDIGVDAPTDDAKVNLGVAVLQALFKGWREASRADTHVTAVKAIPSDSAGSAGSSDAMQPNGGKNDDEIPVYFTVPSDITVILSEENGANSIPLVRRTVAELSTEDGLRELAAFAPQWLLDCVVKGEFRQKEQKVQFLLVPQAGSGDATLPPMPEGVQSKLTAHRVLKVKRVCKYVTEKLGLQLPDDCGPDDVVEILCGDRVMPAQLNIATIRQFVWKGAGDDLTFTYRRKLTTQEDACLPTV